jgi:hypothetical protein
VGCRKCEPLWGENRPMDSNDLSDRKKPTPLEEKAWFQIGFADRPVTELATELRSVAETAGDTAVPDRPIPI